jgi:hypothetical protein
MQFESVSQLKSFTLSTYNLQLYLNVKFITLLYPVNFVYQSDSESSFLIQGQGLHVIEDTRGITSRI